MRQSRVALAAEHDLGMLETGMGERKVIQAMLEHDAEMVTPKPLAPVKLDRPIGPSSCTCGKMTSAAGRNAT